MSNQEVLMDVIRVEDRESKLVEAKVPLGLEGVTLKAEVIVANGDREGAGRLAERVGYLSQFANEFLLQNWRPGEKDLGKNLAEIEGKIRAEARSVSGKQFLMDLGSRPQESLLARLALEHSLVAAAAGGSHWERIEMGLSDRYQSLQRSLTDFAEGKPWREPNYMGEMKRWREREASRVASTAVEPLSRTESKVDRIDESLGPLRNETEAGLVREINGALANQTAFGFLHNRKELSWTLPEDGDTRDGLRNRSLKNLTLKEADDLETYTAFNFPGGYSAVKEGQAVVSLITQPQSMKEPPRPPGARPEDKAELRRFGADQAWLRLGYAIEKGDYSGRSGTWQMYLGLPRALAGKIYRYGEAQQEDDPTAVVRILGHALGEDLNINYEKEGVAQFARLNVRAVRLEQF